MLKTEPGKIIYTKDIIRKETGGRILDKTTAEMASTFKCAFWPGCTGIVNMGGKMVRGGVIVRPADHPKYGTTVYICDDHDEEDYESDKAGALESILDTVTEKSEDEDEDEDLESSFVLSGGEVPGAKKVEEAGSEVDMFSEDLMLQSLLAKGGSK